MTIADRQHAAAFRRMAAPAAAPGTPASAASRWFVAAWRIGGAGSRGVLEWRLRGPEAGEPTGAAEAVWHPETGPPRTLAGPTPVTWSQDERGLEHADIPRLLSLTLRRTPDGARLLYARTPLLAALGARGGCVDHPVGRSDRST